MEAGSPPPNAPQRPIGVNTPRRGIGEIGGDVLDGAPAAPSPINLVVNTVCWTISRPSLSPRRHCHFRRPTPLLLTPSPAQQEASDNITYNLLFIPRVIRPPLQQRWLFTLQASGQGVSGYSHIYLPSLAYCCLKAWTHLVGSITKSCKRISSWIFSTEINIYLHAHIAQCDIE